jgi:broad-specificity NMP kinase
MRKLAGVHLIDTTDRSPAEVAEEIVRTLDCGAT